jgi:hypothetical protein
MYLAPLRFFPNHTVQLGMKHYLRTKPRVAEQHFALAQNTWTQNDQKWLR